MRPSPLMGEGWVGVMPGVRKVLKLALMGAEARPTEFWSLSQRPATGGHGLAKI
jgi:hypothetical protein